MARRSIIPNHTATRFIHDPRWAWDAHEHEDRPPRHTRTSATFVGGVVHHQMQLSLRVGASELFEEDEELLRAMPRYAQPGDLAGGDIQAPNRV